MSYTTPNKSATEPAGAPIQGCNCASYNNPERVRPTTSGHVPEVVLTPPFDLGGGRETVCVDACIATVVRHLWDCGVVTLGSCCGHGRGRPSLVLGQHDDLWFARACIAEVIPKNRWVGDEYGWDLSQWRLVTNPDTAALVGDALEGPEFGDVYDIPWWKHLAGWWQRTEWKP